MKITKEEFAVIARANATKAWSWKREEYEANPKLCTICSKPIEYKKNKNVTCSAECLLKHKSLTFDPFKINSTKKTQVTVDGILFDSKAESLLFKELESNSISCIKNYKLFGYINIEGEPRKYRPDFYLPDYDLYLEIKGRYYYNLNVVRKLVHFPKNIVIMFSNNFKKELPSFIENLKDGRYDLC